MASTASSGVTNRLTIELQHPTEINTTPTTIINDMEMRQRRAGSWKRTAVMTLTVRWSYVSRLNILNQTIKLKTEGTRGTEKGEKYH